MTEQPESREEWEAMVQYNERILQQDTSSLRHDQSRLPTKVVPRRSDTCGHLRHVSWRVERSNYKPAKPPKPTLPEQQAPRRLLPVMQFLNRQVSSLLLLNKWPK